MMSIPIQCTQEIPACLHEKPQPLTVTAHNPAALCGVDRVSRNAGTFSDLLAEDMSKLCVDGPCQRKENRELMQNVAPLQSMDSSRWQGASSSVSKNHPQADHPHGDRTMHTVRVGGVFIVGRGSPICAWNLPCCSSKTPCLVCSVCVRCLRQRVHLRLVTS